MAFSLDHLLESVVPAVISGGGTAISTILAFFRDVKKKIEEVEKKVGSLEGKSGLVWSIYLLEETVKKLKEKVEEEPPQRGRRSGSYTNEFIPWDEIQDLVKKEVDRRLEDVDERLTKLERRVQKFVTEDDFEKADGDRAREIAGVKQTMAEIRGLLEGLRSALGLIKPPGR